MEAQNIKNIDLNCHIFTQLKDQMQTLMQPLSDKLGLTTLVYQRKYDNGEEIRVSNRPDWLAYYYQHELYLGSQFEIEKKSHPEFVLWQSIAKSHKAVSHAVKFNIDHGLTYINPRQGYRELFFMGAPSDNSLVINRVINNLSFVANFSQQFTCKAEHMIAQAESQKVILPQQDAVQRATFRLDILSARELIVAKKLLLGGSAKCIALQIGGSYRTVETHIQNMKRKLNCQSKTALIAELWFLGLKPD
ncbi:helix-turn-helix transcriptional regulator [Fastidiosibacter lacustris]|uniref:helix-turn-helix transcriptional regulator n=1 Tax=Fastidiosibacter lacustris TaxID=2056695 RepID=UPI000E351ECA|nr:helix-turn-helix transcriptional regulator [Fastidiosibacter lacustris]